MITNNNKKFAFIPTLIQKAKYKNIFLNEQILEYIEYF